MSKVKSKGGKVKVELGLLKWPKSAIIFEKFDRIFGLIIN